MTHNLLITDEEQAMTVCGAEIQLPPFGTVVCTKRKGHKSDHEAIEPNRDAVVHHQWTGEIDELADRRNP